MKYYIVNISSFVSCFCHSTFVLCYYEWFFGYKKAIYLQCTSHNDCCSNSCLTYSYKCVEYHGNRRNDEEPLTASSIDALVEKISNDNDSAVSTFQNDSTVAPTTVSSMATIPLTNQPASTPNKMDHNEPDCRVNEFSVRICSISLAEWKFKK